MKVAVLSVLFVTKTSLKFFKKVFKDTDLIFNRLHPGVAYGGPGAGKQANQRICGDEMKPPAWWRMWINHYHTAPISEKSSPVRES